MAYSSLFGMDLQPSTETTLLSPESFSTFDEYASNPRFQELQEELRSLLFIGANSNAPTRSASPIQDDRDGQDSSFIPQHNSEQYPLVRQDIMRSIVSTMKRVEYLKIWTTECAPWLDMFDSARHFGIQVPIIAQSCPTLLYAMLALSARQIERHRGLKGAHESLELYQESIRLLHPLLEARDTKSLVTTCILCCLEMMSVSPRDWRRHIEGCVALFLSFGVHGFSGGLLQAVFWCFARMDLCGAIISDGAEPTVLPINKWVAISDDLLAGSPGEPEEIQEANIIRDNFIQRGKVVPDMYANYAVYLCAKVCNLVSAYTRHVELGEYNFCAGEGFQSHWFHLWTELHTWVAERCKPLIPIKTVPANGKTRLFPDIFYVHWAAISSNQLYHTACIMMLEIKPFSITLEQSSPTASALWHARRVVGISNTNSHRGCLNNAIQPLYVAGRLLSHRSEHEAIIKLIKRIEETTGWGACWRIKDLEEAWGYERNSLLQS
ncbi:hypothetical protein F5884DRAFT_27804 [Xylogone sp. PMI_703]|nr:hypothetical protein F5884DRAFT_27804 [Xylogone sp. PMI_703]